MKPEFATLAFNGGGFDVSAQTLYEREVLVEYVTNCARTKRDLRVTLGQQTWRVEAVSGEESFMCDQCHRPLRQVRLFGSRAGDAACIVCALKVRLATPPR